MASSEFLQLLSHELRTPLTGIRGYGDLLAGERAGPLTERQRYMLTMLNSCVHRLDSLVDDLLLIAAVDAGVYGLVVEDVDLSQLTEQAVRAHTAHARPDEPAVRWTYTTRTTVQGDPRQLAHLVAALLNHAVGRFAASERIDITAHDRRITVTTDKSETAGTVAGLGPAVVQAIAERHGGSVTSGTQSIVVELPGEVAAGDRVVHRRARR